MGLYWGYVGIMENEMETNIVYWGFDSPLGATGHHAECLARAQPQCAAETASRADGQQLLGLLSSVLKGLGFRV